MKKISVLRVIVSLAFFFLFLAGYLFPLVCANWFPVDAFLYVQFIPSLILSLLNHAWLAGSGFILVILLTYFFGRVYCSFCCPLGYVQDFFIWISRYRKKKNRFSKGYLKIRYAVFALFLLFLLFGSPLLIQLLDPYSLAGKMIHAVAIPLRAIIQTVSSYGSDTLQKGFATFERETQFSNALYLYVSAALLILVTFSMARGRLYCNTMCPVGMILGLISKKSRYRFSLDHDLCTQCRKCERVCPSRCIDSKNLSVDMELCVSCFECLDSCPETAVQFSQKRVSKPGDTSSAKRYFMLSSVISLFSFVLLNSSKKKSGAEENELRRSCVIPPGAQNINRYAASCTACNLCVETCYSKVLNPVYFRHGLKGVFVPTLDFSRGKCAYECNLCSQICPTGAILPVPLEKKKRVQIGQVELLKKKCIVYELKKDCGACAEVCPTHAVYTEKREGLRYPETKEKSCVGCGACENVCPVKPKAIIVSGNTVHLTADKPYYPEDKKTEEKVFKPDEEFPF